MTIIEIQYSHFVPTSLYHWKMLKIHFYTWLSEGLRLSKVHVQDGRLWVERMDLKLMSEPLRCYSVSPRPLLTIVTNPPRLAVLCLDLVIHRFDSDCWQESFSWLQRWQKNPSPILYHQLILSHRLMTFSNKNSFYNIIALKEMLNHVWWTEIK